MNFSDIFTKATVGRTPYPYQERFAECESLPELLSVPTGVGKTATAVLGWLFRRQFQNKELQNSTPRRLVYCLPMRTLVDQTERVAKAWLSNLKSKLKRPVHVETLMGGVDPNDWDRHPEQDAIIIGTQDMLLSRALNRGYGMSRYRWPIHFGLLNNDCLWVMDETQLMGVGLATTAQLQGLRAKLETFGITHSLWMSATLDDAQLDTFDHPRPKKGFAKLELNKDDRKHAAVKQRLTAKKPLRKARIALTADTEKKAYAKDLAAEIVSSHREGTLTLAVLNRVARAQQVYAELKKLLDKQSSEINLLLIHARFRPIDRKTCEDQLFSDDLPAAGRIVVATQAIEAGVDISAATLFSELAPWPSLVQRFGRCNRGGEIDQASITWIDVSPKDEKDRIMPPYDSAELNTSRKILGKLKDVGPASLEDVDYQKHDTVVHVLRRKDLLDLWDTTPDLAGNDLDVSRFIRESDDTDLQVYWRSWEEDVPPVALPAAERNELCSVSVTRARDFLKKIEKNHTALTWKPLDRAWKAVRPDEIRSGMMLLLPASAGGYSHELGWTGDSAHQPTPILPASNAPNESAMDDERESENPAWVTLSKHLEDVVAAVDELKTGLKGSNLDLPWPVLRTAAQWHDVGKAHPAFQNMILRDCGDAEQRRAEVWAKLSGQGLRRATYWVDGADGREDRIGFRHELASALTWLAHHDGEEQGDLIAYLIAAHHGKVRASIRSLPNERGPRIGDRTFARGVWDRDEIAEVSFDEETFVPRTRLNLGLMVLGDRQDSKSWLSRVLDLRDELGPFRLCYLESLLRVADWRGSAIGASNHET